jgi:predicted HTH transcriptional regulator
VTICEALASTEGTALEFKCHFSSPKPLLKTQVAFANAAVGRLVGGSADGPQVPLASVTEQVIDQVTDQVTEQVSDQMRRLLDCLHIGPLSVREAMKLLQLKHRPTFISSYLQPALDAGLVEMTQPNSPNSPTQQYRLVNPKLHQ